MEEKIRELESKLARVEDGYNRLIRTNELFKSKIEKSPINKDAKDSIIKTVDMLTRDLQLAIGKLFYPDKDWSPEERIRRC